MKWPNISCPAPKRQRSPQTLINRYPDRFLFGTDEVAPADAAKYLKVFYQYEPLWSALDPSIPQGPARELRANLRRGAREGS